VFCRSLISSIFLWVNTALARFARDLQHNAVRSSLPTIPLCFPMVAPARPSSDQGALFTTPLALAALDNDSRTCPICHEDYTEPYTSDSNEIPGDANKEWAVSVDMVAEIRGRKRCCGHIIGRRCLKKHISGRGLWKNKCPLCRDVWFGINATAHTGTTTSPRAVRVDHSDRSSQPLRRSLRIAAQATTQRESSVYRMSNRNGVGPSRRAHRSDRHSDSSSFVQDLLGTLGVVEGSDQVQGTLEQVERQLEGLYNGLQ
jgi:hypothetical protein